MPDPHMPIPDAGWEFGLPSVQPDPTPTVATEPASTASSPESTTPVEPEPVTANPTDHPAEDLDPASTPAITEVSDSENEEPEFFPDDIGVTPEEELERPEFTIQDPEQFQKNAAAFEAGRVPSGDLDTVLLIKDGYENVTELLANLEKVVGTEKFLRDVLVQDSPTNILYRFIFDTYGESYRVRDALASLPKEQRDALTTTFRDPKDPKNELKTFVVKEKLPPGNTVDDSDTAYQRQCGMDDDAARGRFLMYESGIGIDLIMPQNSDFETLYRLLGEAELAQYVSVGLESYSLVSAQLKEITLRWLNKFITNCSYKNWGKPGALAKILTLNDFNVLMVYLGNLVFPNGFDRFVDRCFRPADKDHPTGCDHQENITIVPSELIVTRFPLLSETQLAYMLERRTAKAVTMADITAYRQSLSFAYQVITHRDYTLTLSLPTLDHYFSLARASYAASASVILGGNIPSVLQDMTTKGFRDLAVYVSSFTRTKGDRSLTSSNARSIMETIGAICDEDERLCDPDNPEEFLLYKIQQFSAQCQLSYVGFKTKPCPKCGYVNPNTDGWAGVDGLRTFFTIGRSNR